MVTIIASSLRADNYTIKVAECYRDLMVGKSLENKLFSLDQIPNVLLDHTVYHKGDNLLREFGHSIFTQSNRLVMIVPEYNGSIPGVLKFVLDSCDPAIFKGKRVAMVGVSSGRAGNLRGMDHLTDIFHFLQAEVYSFKLPISQIRNLVNTEKELVDAPTIQLLEKHIDGFANF